MAYGAPARSRIGGAATRVEAATSEPANAPAETLSSASTATPRNGSAANGISPTARAATRTSSASPSRCGWRSATRPPTQYPTDSDTSTTPIVFAHTIVDAPKNGAIRRAAAISAPSVAMPTEKTSSSSGGRALLVVGREVGLSCAADGAEPVAGDVIEGGARWDAAVRVSLGWIVDEAARLADPLLHGDL